MTPRSVSSAAVLLAAGALIAGCGSSGGDTTSAPAAASSTPTAAASAPAPTAVTDGKLALTAKDFSFSEKAITVKAGKLAVSLENMGQAPHEFILLRTSADPASLPVKGARVSETTSVGEIAEIAGGKAGTHTFDLKAGKYVFVCNVPGHYADGMRGSLTVE